MCVRLAHFSPCPSVLPFCCLLLCAIVCSDQCFCFPAYIARPVAHDQAQAPRQDRPLGVVSFPVYHKLSLPRTHADAQERRSRRLLNPSWATPASSTSVPNLRSELVTLARPFGQYFAELQIGTPTTALALIVDSGSQLLWIQCRPCVHCGQQADGFPVFDPATSSSYQNLMCDAEICQPPDDTVRTSCTASGTCSYTVSYTDESHSSGILAAETLTLTNNIAYAGASTTSNDTSSSFTLPQFVFGCGVDNAGLEARLNASGLMGLGWGIYSIVSQLGVDVFSYCLPNRANSVDVSGYLTFGGGASNAIPSDSSNSSSNPSLQYTPMIQNTYSHFLSQFYYLSLDGVSVRGELLDIPAEVFEVDVQTGLGGTIIDSGTTLTTFVDEAYTIITQAFDNHMKASYKKVDLQLDKLCYEVPIILTKQKGAPIAPKVTLHFAGPVDMELGTDQLLHLYASDAANNYYCLAMAGGGPSASGAKNVIGNYQQQDLLVEYDLANSRVGFAPTRCSTIAINTAPSLPTLTLYFCTMSCIWILLLL